MILKHDFDSFLDVVAFDRTPEQILLIKILERAFWDAMGANADITSAEGRRNTKINARLFLLNKIPSQFGFASEMSIVATGSDWFLRKLIEFIDRGDYSTIKDGTRKNFFRTKDFKKLREEVCLVK